MQAESRDLDVRVVGHDELLIMPASAPVRCYMRLPNVLGATRLLTTDMHTCAVEATGLPRRAGEDFSRGASFDLPARFRGSLEVLNAAGTPVVAIKVQRLGSDTKLDATVRLPEFEVVARSGPRMLDVSVQPRKARTLIR